MSSKIDPFADLPCMVADSGLAEWGRKEIQIAEHEIARS